MSRMIEPPGLAQLFEIAVVDRQGQESVLLVVAADEPEARALVRSRGRVSGVSAIQGPLAIRGGSRVVATVLPRSRH